MELILERTELREDCTVGTLSVIKRVDDEYLAGETKDFLYDTLEPRVKELDAKNTKSMIYVWKNRGYIYQLSDNSYKKVK